MVGSFLVSGAGLAEVVCALLVVVLRSVVVELLVVVTEVVVTCFDSVE